MGQSRGHQDPEPSRLLVSPCPLHCPARPPGFKGAGTTSSPSACLEGAVQHGDGKREDAASLFL